MTLVVMRGIFGLRERPLGKIHRRNLSLDAAVLGTALETILVRTTRFKLT